MSFFSKIKSSFTAARKVWNSADSKTVKMSEIIDLFSINGGGEYGEDLGEIVYFICLKVLSESMGKIPVYLLDSDKNRIKDHDSIKSLQVSTNRWQTPAQFFTVNEYNRNHYGNAYNYIKRGTDGELESLIPLDPRYMQIYIDNISSFDNRRYIYFYCDPRTGKSYYLNAEDVLHFRSWICEDNGIVGRSVREILARTLTGAKASSEYLNKLYSNGMLANLCVHYVGDLNDKEQEALLNAIEKQARNKNRKMISVPMEFKVEPLDLKLADSQFFELKQFTSLQIAAAFGVLPNLINDFSKASYANSVMQQLMFLTNTVLYNVTTYEQEMGRKLLTAREIEAGYHFKFNTNVLLRTTPDQQSEIINKLVQSGCYSPNDARKWLDMPPIPGNAGNQYFVNGSYVSLDNLGAAYQNEQTGNRTV